jgi:hypothetical protein
MGVDIAIKIKKPAQHLADLLYKIIKAANAAQHDAYSRWIHALSMRFLSHFWKPLRNPALKRRVDKQSKPSEVKR